MQENGRVSEQDMEENKSEGHPEILVGLLKEMGVLPDDGISDESIRKAKSDKRRNAYHNTIMLLQNYRTIVWLLECFPDDVSAELDRPFRDLDSLLGSVDLELSWGNKKLENRLEGIQRSRLLIDRLNEALTVLKKKPSNGRRLYELIHLSYIAPELLTHEELLYRLGISSRNYYRLRRQAVTVLSVRLWSAPDKEVDAWLEILSVFEGMEA